MSELGFIGGCYGVQTDVGASISLNLGLWRNLDDIPGESYGTGLALNTPGIEFGGGVSLVLSNDDHSIIGVVLSVSPGSGVGLSPIDLSFFICETPYTRFIDRQVCNAKKNDWRCCSSSYPCSNGQGDCDSNSDCAGKSICGKDNCKKFDSAWSHSQFDCCTAECEAKDNDWGCCSSSNPCSIGQGDCDYDSDCAGNLVCGTDNCRDFTSAWSHSAFDCCIEDIKIGIENAIRKVGTDKRLSNKQVASNLYNAVAKLPGYYYAVVVYDDVSGFKKHTLLNKCLVTKFRYGGRNYAVYYKKKHNSQKIQAYALFCWGCDVWFHYNTGVVSKIDKGVYRTIEGKRNKYTIMYTTVC